MKLDSFPMVERIVAARKKLVLQRDFGKFNVTIDGTYQDDAMVEAVRVPIMAVLDARIAELDADLVQLGVIIDTQEPEAP